jgi:hypothetical protein
MKTKIIKVLGLSTLLQLALAGTGTLQASIYKCVSADDEVIYISTPCPVNHEEKEMEHSKDPKGGALNAYQQKALASKKERQAAVRKSVTVGKKDTSSTKTLRTSASSENSSGGSDTEISSSAKGSTGQSSESSSIAAGSSGDGYSDLYPKPATKFSALKAY